MNEPVNFAVTGFLLKTNFSCGKCHILLHISIKSKQRGLLAVVTALAGINNSTTLATILNTYGCSMNVLSERKLPCPT